MLGGWPFRSVLCKNFVEVKPWPMMRISNSSSMTGRACQCRLFHYSMVINPSPPAVQGRAGQHRTLCTLLLINFRNAGAQLLTHN